MFKNLVLISLRNFLKNKLYVLLNLFGLISGLVAFILIFIWVDYERKIDSFHVNDNQLYRVLRNNTSSSGQLLTDFVMSKPLAEALEDDYEEIENTVLVFWEEEVLFKYQEKAIKDNGFYAGDDFFKVFSFDLVQGTPGDVLKEINSIAISESLSEKLFGTTASLGNVLEIKNYGQFSVSGVFSDVPDNSTLEFNYVLPLEHYYKDNEWVEQWDNYGFKLYATVRPSTDVAALENKIRDITKRYAPEMEDEIFLQKFSDSYLNSDFENGVQAGGRIDQIYLILAVGVFLLIISGINFVNLSTALATRRAKEVSIRKVLGVSKGYLIFQFLMETSIIVLCSIILANVISSLILPYFSQVTNTPLSYNLLSPGFWLMQAGLWILVTVITGIYPAMILSGFNPVEILKGHSSDMKKNDLLRKALVVIQFSISIILIIGTFVILRQYNFIQEQNIGINKENVIKIPLEGGLKSNYVTLKQQLLSNPNIEYVSATGQNPMEVTSKTSDLEWNGSNPDEKVTFTMITSDFDLLKTLGIEVIEGRDFSREFSTDSSNFIVNERAAQIIGRQNIIGKELRMNEESGTIVGMIKDYHNATLYSPVEPMIIRIRPQEINRVLIKTNGNDTKGTLASIETIVSRYNTEFPFEYSFMEDNFKNRYRREAVTSTLIQSFTYLIIIISCLGLFALATYVAERKNKEVGVRKALGASVSSILIFMSWKFLKLILVAYIIAIPIAYFATDKYLDDFSYRIGFNIDIYILSGLLIFIISIATTGYQALKSANLNPTKVLSDS
ncbi:ABC transporter permease [Roseivirga sp. BDSF3-8]|uniref:ABC transporter permease n=1 Tax=Roseivirga sp. BDSF3-8 TaxID=3241598 RepID=UPI003531BDB5